MSDLSLGIHSLKYILFLCFIFPGNTRPQLPKGWLSQGVSSNYSGKTTGRHTTRRHNIFKEQRGLHMPYAKTLLSRSSSRLQRQGGKLTSLEFYLGMGWAQHPFVVGLWKCVVTIAKPCDIRRYIMGQRN